MKKLTIKNSDLLLRFIKIFGKIKTSFAKSLKGEEKLSIVFWGWVVIGNLVWVMSTKYIVGLVFWPIFNVYGLFFEKQFCEYFLSYGIRAKVACFVVSLALILMMYISYPLLSQFLLLKASKDPSVRMTFRIIVKLLSILTIIGLFAGLGVVNLWILILGHEQLFR